MTRRHPFRSRHSAHRRLLTALGLCLAFTPALNAQSTSVSKLAGSWTWSWNDKEGQKHLHVLEVEGVGPALAAREVYDSETPVKATSLTFDGANVKFTVVRGERHAEYSGKLEGSDTITGRVTTTTQGQVNEFPWKAERRKVVVKFDSRVQETPGSPDGPG